MRLWRARRLIGGRMNNLRCKRLLMLARTVNADHKRWYSQYCILMREGLVSWALGMAFLTPKGEDWLRQNEGTPR